MGVAHGALGALALALCTAAAAWGGWKWYRVEPGGAFWPLLRAAQVALVLEAAWGGVLLLLGRSGGELHALYGVLPLLVMFLGEQLRAVAAQAVLDTRGIGSPQAVGELPDREQRSVVVAILRREVGVMALASLVSLSLGLRALAGTGWI